MKSNKYLYVITFVTLFTHTIGYANNNSEFIIETGMNSNEASRILNNVKAHKIADGSQSSVPHDEYILTNNLWLSIFYNSDKKIISHMTLDSDSGISNFRNLPKSKSSSVEIDKINVKTVDIVPLIIKADEEAIKIIDDFNCSESVKNMHLKLSLGLYSLSVYETTYESREAIQADYQLRRSNSRGQQQHFSVLIYRKTMEAHIFKGR